MFYPVYNPSTAFWVSSAKEWFAGDGLTYSLSSSKGITGFRSSTLGGFLAPFSAPYLWLPMKESFQSSLDERLIGFAPEGAKHCVVEKAQVKNGKTLACPFLRHQGIAEEKWKWGCPDQLFWDRCARNLKVLSDQQGARWHSGECILSLFPKPREITTKYFLYSREAKSDWGLEWSWFWPDEIEQFSGGAGTDC